MDVPPAAPSEDKITVAVCDDVCVARVVGRGSFKISGLLRDFGYRMADARHRPLMLDMQGCIGMDSTFMGTIANLSFKYKQSQSPRIHLVNLSDKNHQIACTLGLQYLVTIHQQGQAVPDAYARFLDRHCRESRLDPAAESKRAQAEVMLEAHQTLANLSAQNLEKFQDVIEYLRQELDQQGGASDSNGM